MGTSCAPLLADLFLTISQDFKWKSHVHVYNVCTKKANKTLGFLRRHLSISSPSVKEQDYKSITRPPLDHEYACTAWDPTIKGKSVNSEWSDAGMKGSSPTDSQTHLVLVTCYNT